MISFAPPVPRIGMIVSSVRPFARNKPYAEHQKAALDSWHSVGRRLVLFNEPSDLEGYDHSKIELVSGIPSVKSMLSLIGSSFQTDTAIITNADIIFTSGMFRVNELATKNNLGQAWAATAPSIQFDVPLWRKEGKLEGESGMKGGYDFFLATRHVFASAAKEMPDWLTLGRPLWNQWLNDYLRTHVMVNRYHDISGLSCAWHPQHVKPFPTMNKYSRLELDSLKLENMGPPKKRYA